MFHVEAIQSNYKVLLRCTTINFYVTDSLRADDIIDDVQESDLRAERSHLRQRILLFQWLKEVSSDRYESFLKVMKDTEQEHVANLLRGRTDETHLPLSNARYERLEKIRPKLAKVTRTDTEVLAGLRRLEAISDTDDDEIRAEKVEYVKSSKLISAIMRRSNHSYDSFQEVLRKTLQETAAEYLNEGEMPAVHLNNNRSDLDEPLAQAFNDVIRNGTENDPEIISMLSDINGPGLNLVNAIPGQSIVIFIYCKTIDSAVKFMQLFNSGRLQYILGRILNRLLLTIESRGTEDLDSRISLEDDDIISLEEFTGLEGFVGKNPYRPKPSYKPRGRDVAAQTDEQEILKTSTEWSPMGLTETKPFNQDLSLLPYNYREAVEDIYLASEASGGGGRPSKSENLRIRNEVVNMYKSFVSEVDPKDVLDLLTQRRIISIERKEEVLSKVTRQDRCRALLDQLFLCSNDKAFLVLRQALIEDYYWIVERIDESKSAKYNEVISLENREICLELEQKLEMELSQKYKRHLVQEKERIIGAGIDDLPGKYTSTPVLVHTIGKKSGKKKKLPLGLPTRTKASAAEEEKKSIRGLTILDKELFVVSELSSDVEVYDSIKLSISRRWNLKELIRPMDIGSCKRNKCLYIFDCKGHLHSNEILRVDPNGKLIRSWSTGVELGYGLSVTGESNVVLTDYNKNRLNEYSPDGQLIREINLSNAGIQWPWHAIKLSNGNFVVSHGSIVDDLHRVCIVDSDGKFKKSFGGKCGSTIGQMNRPVYLSVDGNGFVMVADQLNRRVLLLDSNLEFRKEILSKEEKHELHDPWNIILDESNNRLFVADNESDNQRILIFDFI